MVTRRNLLTATAAAAATGAVLAPATARAQSPRQWEASYSGGSLDVEPLPPGEPGRDYQPVIVPSGGKVPWSIRDGVKVFHLTVGELEHEFTAGLVSHAWGYNGRVDGSVIEAVEGERVRIYVENRLPYPTSVHWHGLYLPNGMDGVSGITQPPIPPGETWRYEFTLRQHGTFMYHSHHDTMTQEGMGLSGMFIIHPRHPRPDDRVDRDFSLLLKEYMIDPGTRRINPNEMSDFNVLTINGKAFPGTEPLVTKTGDRVRIRIGNLSAMDHHPFHVHGYNFKVTETDGERIPVAGQWPETSVLVAVGQTRTIEFISDAPGDWIMHCHMTHHTMNQMGHDIPNLVGADPEKLSRAVGNLLPGYMTMGTDGMGEHAQHMLAGHMAVPPNSVPMLGAKTQYGYTGMGGMFTFLKVRDELASDGGDPGWYQHPPGTVAAAASAQELERDGIKLAARPARSKGAKS